MEEKNDWSFLKKIGKPKLIDSGADSRGFSVTSNENDEVKFVAKLYDRINFNSIEPTKAKEVLRQYYADTEEATQILEAEPNPLNQYIVINNETFPLEYVVIPQGAVMLEKNTKVSYHTKKGGFVQDEKRRVKALVGQKFINGANLGFLMDGEKIEPKGSAAETQRVFINNDKLCDELDNAVKELFPYLSKKLNVKFTYNSLNVKPFIDEKAKKVILVITDLAANLKIYYEQSDKFREIRSET